MSKLLLTPEEKALLMQKYHKGTIKTLTELADALCQSQLDNVLQKQSEALRDYTDNKISFEKLAERLGISFYELHTAFEKYIGGSNSRKVRHKSICKYSVGHNAKSKI